MRDVASFPPSIDTSCRVLVLGSAPSVRSLELGQYYGHARNLFWPFMQELLEVGVSLPYGERLRGMRRRGAALWDVAGTCVRHASNDATIGDVVPNDFAALFRKHPRVRAVFFNGAKSAELYERLVLPRLGPAQQGLHRERLPSTSPANASIPRAAKLRRWRRLLDWL